MNVIDNRLPALLRRAIAIVDAFVGGAGAGS